MTNSTRAIVALIDIMTNKDAAMRRRIEAAEAILTYEAPEQVVEQTKEFLASVFEDREEVATDDRLEASRLMRKAEARKIAPQAAVRTDETKYRDREHRREIEMGLRRLKLDEAGLWEFIKRDWADDLLSPDFEPREWPALHEEARRLRKEREAKMLAEMKG